MAELRRDVRLFVKLKEIEIKLFDTSHSAIGDFARFPVKRF